MKPSLIASSVIAAGLAVAALTGCSSSTTAEDQSAVTGDQLVGTWGGTNAGYEGIDAVYVDKPLTLVVQEASGQAFFGFKEWTEPDGAVADEFIRGVVTPGGLVTIVDGDGVFEGVVSGSTLTGTYVEVGDDAAALEVELTKQ